MSTVEDRPLANSAIKTRTLKSFTEVSSLALRIAYTRYEYLNSALYLGCAQEFQCDNYKVGLVNIGTSKYIYMYIYGKRDL